MNALPWQLQLQFFSVFSGTSGSAGSSFPCQSVSTLFSSSFTVMFTVEPSVTSAVVSEVPSGVSYVTVMSLRPVT